MTGIVEEAESDNFKSEVARHQERAGSAYEHSLQEIWSITNRLHEQGGLNDVRSALRH